MYFFKILGMLMVSVGGGAVCHFLCKREGTALRRAEAWESLCLFIGSQVECFALPIGQILLRADRTLLRECGYTVEAVPPDLKTFMRGVTVEDRLTRDTAEKFCGEFGRGGANEQAARCRYYAGIFEERKKKISAELPSKKKLYYTLCISASLAVLIIFL